MTGGDRAYRENKHPYVDATAIHPTITNYGSQKNRNRNRNRDVCHRNRSFLKKVTIDPTLADGAVTRERRCCGGGVGYLTATVNICSLQTGQLKFQLSIINRLIHNQLSIMEKFESSILNSHLHLARRVGSRFVLRI